VPPHIRGQEAGGGSLTTTALCAMAAPAQYGSWLAACRLSGGRRLPRCALQQAGGRQTAHGS
jgi:hypothetical protein